MELARMMRTVLSDSFIMYFKAHTCHWNIEGMNFPQYHEFFGKIYEEVYGAIDEIAEEIRKLNYPAPCCLSEMYKDKSVTEHSEYTMDRSQMLMELDQVNSQVLVSLNRAFDMATMMKEQGLVDFLSARISAHKKHEWMIRASMK